MWQTYLHMYIYIYTYHVPRQTIRFPHVLARFPQGNHNIPSVTPPCSSMFHGLRNPPQPMSFRNVPPRLQHVFWFFTDSPCFFPIFPFFSHDFSPWFPPGDVARLVPPGSSTTWPWNSCASWIPSHPWGCCMATRCLGWILGAPERPGPRDFHGEIMLI